MVKPESTLKVVYLPINQLSVYGKNPRTIKDEKFQKLCLSLKANPKFFEARPCLVNIVDGEQVVYAGNQRLKAAKSIGLKTVPCIVETLTEAEMKERMIRDNAHSGEWDAQALALDFSKEQLQDWGDFDVGAAPVLPGTAPATEAKDSTGGLIAKTGPTEPEFDEGYSLTLRFTESEFDLLTRAFQKANANERKEQTLAEICEYFVTHKK